jgi:hypothetical protein
VYNTEKEKREKGGKGMGCPYSKADRLPHIDWKTIQLTGKTGDILLFGGQSAFGLLEECLTSTPYSHVAILFRHPKTGRLYVAESSGLDELVDHFTGRPKSGPRLVDAREKIIGYGQKYGWGVVYRKLSGRAVERIRADTDRMLKLYEWFRIQSPKHFERHKYELVESYLRGSLLKHPEDTCSWFCSEYVSAAWKQMGIPMLRQPDGFCPQDYMEDEEDLFMPAFNDEMGGYLGPEQLVVQRRGVADIPFPDTQKKRKG